MGRSVGRVGIIGPLLRGLHEANMSLKMLRCWELFPKTDGFIVQIHVERGCWRVNVLLLLILIMVPRHCSLYVLQSAVSYGKIVSFLVFAIVPRDLVDD